MNTLKINQKIYFKSENLPYTVMSVSDRYAICSRKLDRTLDRNLLQYQVEMGGYFTLNEAYNQLKNNPVYTIIDLIEKVRGKDNLIFGIYDYFDKDDCNKCLQDLENGTIEISHRNKKELDLI